MVGFPWTGCPVDLQVKQSKILGMPIVWFRGIQPMLSHILLIFQEKK